MSTLGELRSAYEQANEVAVGLSNEYESTRAAAKETYGPRIREANERLVEAQKALNDAEAFHELLKSEDVDGSSGLARSLGFVSDHDEFLAARSAVMNE